MLRILIIHVYVYVFVPYCELVHIVEGKLFVSALLVLCQAVHSSESW